MLQTYTSKVKAKDLIAPNIYRFVFSLGAQTLEFTPGQYVLIDVGGGYRQYSISSSPALKNEVETVVDVTPMGLGSKYLLGRTIGDEVNFRAALGVFTLKETPRPKIFLATGTGITPIKSMIEALVEKNFSVPFHLIWGLRSRVDMYYQEELSALKKKSAFFSYHYCLSREDSIDETCLKGHVQDGLKKLSETIPSFSAYEFYLCGRPQMVEEVRAHLIETLQLDKAHIFNEKFT